MSLSTADPTSSSASAFAPATVGPAQPAAATSTKSDYSGFFDSSSFGTPSTNTNFFSGQSAPIGSLGTPSNPTGSLGAPSTTGHFLGHHTGNAPTPRVNASLLFDPRDHAPDMVLQYQGQAICARRSILCRGAPKLKAMFDVYWIQPPLTQYHMPVYILDKVIQGFQFADLCCVIKFCYTGSFDAGLPLARLVHIALVAEEFGIMPSLSCQALCMDKVRAQTSVEPILKALETAHQNGLAGLKLGIMNHLKQAGPHLGATPQDYMRLDKDLLIDLLRHIAGMVYPST